MGSAGKRLQETGGCESLGAKVQQHAIPAGPADLDRYAVAAALWVGTPGGEQALRLLAVRAHGRRVHRDSGHGGHFSTGRPAPRQAAMPPVKW